MFIKQFDKSLHDRYDEPAKDFVKNYYNEQGIKAVDNPNKYDVDLILYKDTIKIGYAEVEVCAGWTGAIYPFKTYHIPIRKSRFFNLDLPTYFFSISNTFLQALYINGDEILSSPIIEVPNKYVPKLELFFDIDLSKMTHNKLICMYK